MVRANSRAQKGIARKEFINYAKNRGCKNGQVSRLNIPGLSQKIESLIGPHGFAVDLPPYKRFAADQITGLCESLGIDPMP